MLWQTGRKNIRRNRYSFSETLNEGILVFFDELEELGVRGRHRDVIF